MASDLYTKCILTVIAACLVLITAQGLGFGPAGAEPTPMFERYQVTALGGMGLLVRLDQATGDTWTMSLRGGISGWSPINEAPRLEEESE